jgi:hypothetical protein
MPYECMAAALLCIVRGVNNSWLAQEPWACCRGCWQQACCALSEPGSSVVGFASYAAAAAAALAHACSCSGQDSCYPCRIAAQLLAVLHMCAVSSTDEPLFEKVSDSSSANAHEAQFFCIGVARG